MDFKFDTLAVRAGYKPDTDTRSVGVPIYPSTAYDFEDVDYARDLFSLKKAGNIYSRLSNPTNDILEERISALEGGVGALAFSSGHAAILGCVLNLASAGDEIVSSNKIYGGCINLFGVTLKKMGITVKFVDPDNLEQVEKAVGPKTKLIFAETIGNPNANLCDIEGLAEIAHKNNIPLIIDSTFTTPYLLKPFEFGADIVIHSATKFLGGHGNAMSGLVVDSGNFCFKGNDKFPEFNLPDKSYHGVVYSDMGSNGFIIRLRAQLMRDMGACPSPFNSYLILNGIETLSLRMKKHTENGYKVAKYLEGNSKIAKVNYPALESSPYYNLAKKYLPKGAGSVFTFEFKDGRKAAESFINNLSLIMNVANVGDVRSLINHPASTTHSQLSDQQLIDAGITDGTVRISVGIEDIEDILYDLDTAFSKI